MARIDEFDFYTVQEIQKEINDVLKQIGEAHGVNLSLHRIKYDRYGFKGYIEAQTVPEGEHGGDSLNYEQKYALDFTRQCAQYGLDPTHLNALVVINGRTYTLIGLKTRARMHKFVCRDNKKGRLYRFSHLTIKQALNLL